MQTTTTHLPKVDTTGLGKHIGRTMHLLASGTAEKHTKLKVVFYGQSIIDENNPWPRRLAQWLRETYPFTDFEPVYKLAVGGYSTQIMSSLTPMDMKKHHPDLVIILITGSHYDYETIVKTIKETTTADVMILTEHISRGSRLDFATWSDTMEREHLPNIAQKHGAELCPLRKSWRYHLVAHNLHEDVFLGADGGHLNSDGQNFILEIVKQFFVRDEEAVAAAEKKLRGEWVDLATDSWKDGVLTIPFHGNRVEVFQDAGQETCAPVEVRINGKKTSEWVELYVHERIGHGWMAPGYLRRLEIKTPHKPQLWTLEFTKWEPVYNTGERGTQQFAFQYTVTGDDAGCLGISTEGRFLSKGKWSWQNSTRDGHFDSDILKINGEDFYFGMKKPFLGARYYFKTQPNGVDIYDGSQPLLFSGLPVGDYVLTLTAADKNNIPKIKRIRVCNP